MGNIQREVGAGPLAAAQMAAGDTNVGFTPIRTGRDSRITAGVFA